MRSVAHLFFTCVILTALPVPQAYAALMQSNGLDGAFAPDSSMLVTPDDNGIFHFTTIDIAEQVLISFDRSSWEGEIYLLATGDINIYGALNTGSGPLHLYTPGVVTLGGKVYGQTITLAGEQIHYINNPNGNPDMHLFGGAYTTIQPDGELEFSIPNPLLEIDARNLTAGVTITAGVFGSMDARDLTGGVIDRMDTAAPLEISYSEPLGAVLLQTPLPPAIWLLLSAITVIGGLGHNRKHRAD